MDDNEAHTWINTELRYHIDSLRNMLRTDMKNYEILSVSRDLIISITQRLYYCNNIEPEYRTTGMPEFEKAVKLIDSDLDDPDISNHWKASLLFLYMQLETSSVPNEASLIQEWLVEGGEGIWMTDLIYLARLQAEPISCSSINSAGLFLQPLRQLIPHKPELQEFILNWVQRSKISLQSGYLGAAGRVMLTSIPVQRRFQYARGVWLQKNGARAIQLISALLQLAEPEFTNPDPFTTSSLITKYFQYLSTKKRVKINPNNKKLQLVLMASGRMKLLGAMCALALLYRLKIPFQIDSAQLVLLLDLRHAEQILGNTVTDYSHYFPTDTWKRLPEGQKQRAALRLDLISGRLLGSQNKFHEILPLSRMFSPSEIVKELLQ